MSREPLKNGQADKRRLCYVYALNKGLSMPLDHNFNKPLMILIALVQGLLLFILHQALNLGFWPSGNYPLLFSFYTLVVAAPSLLLLSINAENNKGLYQYVALFSVVLAGLAFYMGSQGADVGYANHSNLIIPMVATFLVASFKGLMYMQHWALQQPLSYPRLFQLSWRNFLCLALALLFTLCCWGVLMLWAGLFNSVGISFFYDMFTQPWFYYPVLAMANGFGLVLFRQQSSVIDTITRIQQALMKYLLLALVFVSTLFLLVLPVTGLAPLWESGGSSLILMMQGLMLFFLNCVYQDDPEQRPYGIVLHRLIYIGLALLPIYSLISFYGLYLRIEQYGWSVDRCWAALLTTVFFLFSMAYLWGIVSRRDNWLHTLSWANIRMGMVVMVLALVINSPLLDFRKISTSSQIQRFLASDQQPDKLDVRYFRSNLARPGQEALKQLKVKFADTNPALISKIDNGLGRYKKGGSHTEQEFNQATTLVNTEWPEGLRSLAFDHVIQSFWGFEEARRFYLYQTDMDQDGKADYLFIDQSGSRRRIYLYQKTDAVWHRLNVSPRYFGGNFRLAASSKLDVNTIRIRPAKWQELIIGGVIYQVQLPPNDKLDRHNESRLKSSPAALTVQ